MRKLKIRYSFSYPLDTNLGGGIVFVKELVKEMSKYNEINELNLKKPDKDFDYLFVFGCTWVNIEMLEYYKNRGIKIVLFPIFDRNKSRSLLKRIRFLEKLPVLNIFSIRKKIFELSDIIVCAGGAEEYDLVEIYGVDRKKMKVIRQGISSEFLKYYVNNSLDFSKKYSVNDYVFCAASSINDRKGQVQLLKALKDTKIKIVLNNTHKIENRVRKEFLKLTTNNDNLVLLQELPINELVSCYKSAKVFVSLSNSETAGYVNLEAGYCGCNLVVNDIPAFREYLVDKPIFTKRSNLKIVREDILKAMEKDSNSTEFQDFVKKNYTWETYVKILLDCLNSY